ncbi:MAG: hypothetical protein HQ573_01040 [Desulfobacteraceae bacterium]|nr:hypothetical protein [Desulfobacteraceae bacterium]
MNLDEKLDLLDRIYKVYDEFARNLDVACKRYCDSCCTRNVTLTTLEGYKIVECLISDGKADLFNSIRKDLHKKRFQPTITTNRLAELSIAGEDIPDERSRYFQEECPILTDRQCPVYKVRPFGCRCFVSKHSCGEKGYAEVDEFILTVNNIFLQYIEHIDSQGCFGNLIDVLLYFESSEACRNYREGLLNCAKNNLMSNRSIPALMIPPEHRLKIQPILKALLSL